MASQHILRIPRSDSEGDFILINVTKKKGSGLDLKFVATEGESPYAGSLKASQINKLRAKSYKGSDEEWSDILSCAFAQNEPTTGVSQEWKSGLEVVAAIKSDDDDDNDNEIAITLRKRIDTITQRLGTVTLKQDDDQAIQLFDWTGTAVSRADNLTKEISSLEAKYHSAEDTINQLNSQLEDLIQAKNNHDDQLIAKFAQLLNEKKLKIRNQQRLLNTTDADPAKLAQIEAIDEAERSKRTDKDGRSKRKAGDEAPADSESEDAFDTMDVDNKGDNHEAEVTASDEERRSTPEPLEDETASEDDEEDNAPSRPPPKKKSKEPEKKPSPPPPAKPVSGPPPRRELPFTRREKKGNEAAPAAAAQKSGDDEATDSDDEL